MDVLLALDIGGTKIAAGLVTREGTVIDRGRIAVRSNQSDENLFNDVAQLVDAMLTKARGQHGAQPIALGVGCAGPMTENAELVSPLNIPCWRDFPLVPHLRTLTGLPVFADGDAKALALGEGWKGAAKGHDNFLAMVVSTGVGGGIVAAIAVIITAEAAPHTNEWCDGRADSSLGQKDMAKRGHKNQTNITTINRMWAGMIGVE